MAQENGTECTHSYGYAQQPMVYDLKHILHDIRINMKPEMFVAYKKILKKYISFCNNCTGISETSYLSMF